MLLIALTPAGTSSAAFAALFGGNVVFALLMTLVSSLGCIILIPLAFGTIGMGSADGIASAGPPAAGLLVTLSEVLLVPMVLAVPLRRIPVVVAVSRTWGKAITVLLLALMMFLIIANQRQAILMPPRTLVIPLLVAFLSYGVFVAAGLLAFRRAPGNRISAMTCSAYTNSGLTMALAVGFDSTVMLTVVMGQLAWAMLPLVTRPLTARIGAGSFGLNLAQGTEISQIPQVINTADLSLLRSLNEFASHKSATNR